MSAWTSGLNVRRTGWQQTPIVDFLCARCRTHRRITGRAAAADYLKANPIHEHRVICPANQKGTAA